MLTLSIPLILGTRRVGRRSAHVARLASAELARISSVRSELLDLADCDLPVMELRADRACEMLPDVRRFCDELAASDAVLIVTPEYKNSYPGALKNALDYLPADALRRKPVGIVTVSSGPHGGVNCLSQLRLVCLALGGVPIPEHLPVANVQELFDDEGRLRGPELRDRMHRFLQELVWYAEALRNQRTKMGNSV